MNVELGSATTTNVCQALLKQTACEIITDGS